MKIVLACFLLQLIHADLKESADNDQASTYSEKIREVAANKNASVKA